MLLMVHEGPKSRVDAEIAAMHAIASAGGPRRAVWVRADSVLLAAEAPHGLSARNVWPGMVQAMTREPDGAVLVSVAGELGPVLARITAEAAGELRLTVGGRAWAIVKARAL